MINEQRLQEILIELKEKDYTHFSEFYETIKNPIYYNILSLTRDESTAEDLLQDTMVKFLENIPKLKTEQSILGYLIVVSKNLTLDYFKKNNRIVDIDEQQPNMFVHEDTRSVFKMNVLLERISQILTKEEYEIFTLHNLSDLTFKEMVPILNKKLGTLLWKYNECIKKIRKEIDYEDYV